ncbi:MAG: amidase domain-containing protein [Armatimonadetes bacterium]|nr:amidase domain-containing protein [Armatimonadota bacterium]
MKNARKTALSLVVAAAALLVLMVPAMAYDRQAAVGYAYAHASADRGPDDNYAYNPSYRSYGNDCTNFVSQCLRAGGWQDTGWFYYSDWNWFCNGGGWGRHSSTWSWSNAADLFEFLHRSGRASLVNSWQDLQPGDVVQVNWDGGWPVSHTMIVTGYDGWGYPTLTQHSNNRLNKTIWEYLQESPNASFYGWHIR